MAKEQTIEQKQKKVLETSSIGGVGMSILVAYIMLTIQAYLADNVTADFGDAFSALPKILSSDPFYFWPITYDVGIVIGAIVLVILFSFIGYTYNKLRVHHDLNTLKGSAKWADIKQLVKKYADFSGKHYKYTYSNAILSENFQMSINQMKHYHALNTLILGATGSGKSRYYLKPNLLQMNCSYVVTDPSGGILQECGEALRRFGYNVKVFDLVQMGNCDSYNP